ncbi:MAG: aminoglycoside phosphotransferase family protein [Clostridia bacterium]|nr:aminoglycoside phosphotransferase family protein [Clostridia bacterium]
MYDFSSIVKKFQIDGQFVSCVRYGEGHINQTFLLTMDEGEKRKDYILQRINDKLFTDVERLMNNIKLVTEYNRKQIASRGGNPDRESLSLVYATDQKPYAFVEGAGYFRVYKFITDAIAYQNVEKPEHFYQSAIAFGNFASLLSNFDASTLYESIPDFHNTEKRYQNFLRAVEEDRAGRKSLVQKEIEFVKARKDYCSRIVGLLESGNMPKRVTHNDTKLNNVMLDSVTGEPVAVIDLDTIMEGSLCYDFGDSIRFGCNHADEGEPDLSKVNFDIDLFRQYTKGYLKAVGDSITKVEKDNLAFGAILMTYECGMRFLTDYLEGDTYFRIKHQKHNIDRTRMQFKLVTDMEKVLPEMEKIVNEY